MADICWTHASNPPSGANRVGKTFNAAKAGTTNSEAFYHAALEDFARTAALVVSSASSQALLGFVMMETWYGSRLAPEAAPYTWPTQQGICLGEFK